MTSSKYPVKAPTTGYIWELELVVPEEVDPWMLRKAQLILRSYLESQQIKHERLKKGRHRFILDSIDPVIDRSIRDTVYNETFGLRMQTKREE